MCLETVNYLEIQITFLFKELKRILTFLKSCNKQIFGALLLNDWIYLSVLEFIIV